jgi:hypothetical protein
MRAYLTAATIAGLVMLGSQPLVWGQARSGSSSGTSMFGSSGTSTFGQSSIGGSLPTTSLGGMNSFGSTGLSRSSGGTSLGGSSAFGATGLSRQSSRYTSSRFSAGSDVQAARSASQATGADRGTSPQTFRTGSSRQSQRTRSSNRSTTSRAASPYSSYSSSRYGRTSSRYGSSGNEISAAIRLGFQVSLPATAEVSSALASRLADPARIATRSPIEVSMTGRTAILRGAVATEHDRVIAGLLARLEPGIDRVDNQLTVAAAESTGPPPPPR